MLKGEMLMQTLQDFVGTHRIEDLPIPLTIVATDVLARKEVWLRRGDLFDAIRASIAVPTVFTPHLIKGRPLLDGGILNPVPVAPTLQDPTDAIIAVSLSGVPKRVGGSSRRKAEPNTIEKTTTPLPEEDRGIHRPAAGTPRPADEDTTDRQSLSLTDAALLSLDAMQASIARCMLAAYPPDVLIEIPIDTCAAHEFYRAAEVIEAGEYWAEREIRAPRQRAE